MSCINHLREMVDTVLHSKNSPDCDDIEEYVPDKHSRLGQMILRLQDGDLEQRYVHRLEKWLLADQEALKYYVEFSHLCADLHFMLGKKNKQLTAIC